MTQVEDENKEGESLETQPQFDFNHSVILNENDNKFTITATEKINKDEFQAVLDVEYLKLYLHFIFSHPHKNFKNVKIWKILKNILKKNIWFSFYRLYDFPSNKTQHINLFLNKALVKKNNNQIKLSYGFVSPQNIRLKISKNKAFTIDENIKLKMKYKPKNKDLLIITIEYFNDFMDNKWYLPLEYIS